jgi:hypothetical protein
MDGSTYLATVAGGSGTWGVVSHAHRDVFPKAERPLDPIEWPPRLQLAHLVYTLMKGHRACLCAQKGE